MDLSRAAIVAAHPDDEILWFASLFARVGRVVICYGPNPAIPERAAQRRRAVAAYPLATIAFLDLPEPGPGAADADEPHRATLTERLAAVLAGATAVFTHSPWGEYGHLDHRRVNAAVNALRNDMNFAVYVPSYVARHRLREFNEALGQGVGEVLSFPVDRSNIEPIFALYRANNCWTWAPEWRWPEREYFFRFGEGVALRAVAFPVHVFDVEALRPL